MWSLKICSDKCSSHKMSQDNEYEFEKIINHIIFLLTKSENRSHRPEHHTMVKYNAFEVMVLHITLSRETSVNLLASTPILGITAEND